jgi:metal-responsive CopG/Arc/MetJ family transcriptional regulator
VYVCAIWRSGRQTIQVVLDKSLLKAADTAAKRQKMDRSALIRRALQEHLKRLHVLDLEQRERQGYQARPQRVEEYLPWEETAAWPED